VYSEVEIPNGFDVRVGAVAFLHIIVLRDVHPLKSPPESNHDRFDGNVTDNKELQY
jgi:hypothetical protein